MGRLAGRSTVAASVEDFAGVITGALRRGLVDHRFEIDDLALEVEPGRALYGDAGVHLATVRKIKRQTRPLPWT